MLFRIVIYVCSTIVTNILHGKFFRGLIRCMTTYLRHKRSYSFWSFYYGHQSDITKCWIETELEEVFEIRYGNSKGIFLVCLEITEVENKEVVNIPSAQSLVMVCYVPDLAGKTEKAWFVLQLLLTTFLSFVWLSDKKSKSVWQRLELR